MKFSWLANNQIVISRMTALSGGKNYLSTVTSAIVHLQASSPEKGQAFGGVWTKTYVIYCDSTIDVAEGDKIRDQNGKIYKVKKGGVTRHQMGNVDYYRVYIEEVGV